MKDKTAFPFTCKDANQYQYMESGMTLRQYYIGQALQGLCSTLKFANLNNGDPFVTRYITKSLGQQAIECADAVCDLLEKEPE